MDEPNYDDGYKDALRFAIQTIRVYGKRAERVIVIELTEKLKKEQNEVKKSKDRGN